MLDCKFCQAGLIDHDHLLSVPEVAKRRSVHPHTVRAAIKAGELEARRIGHEFIVWDVDADAWTPRQRGRPAALRPGNCGTPGHHADCLPASAVPEPTDLRDALRRLLARYLNGLVSDDLIDAMTSGIASGDYGVRLAATPPGPHTEEETADMWVVEHDPAYHTPPSKPLSEAPRKRAE